MWLGLGEILAALWGCGWALTSLLMDASAVSDDAAVAVAETQDATRLWLQLVPGHRKTEETVFF